MGRVCRKRSMVEYIPERGDIVWVNFNPIRGHEQKGKRPAFVVSPNAYNKKTGMALLCPVTSQKKGYPFEVPMESKEISGVVLSDQIRSVDWKERRISFISKSDRNVVVEVLAKLAVLVQ